jgi:FMN phosphatase YigB (HAD superfamily)
MNFQRPYYDVVMYDFHGVLTSNVGRTTHALVKAAESANLSRKDTRDLLLGLLNRPRGIDARSYIREQTQTDLVERDYGKQVERVYVPQYSWLIRKTKEIGSLTAIVSNGKMRDIYPHIEKWGLVPYLDGVYARGEGGNLGDLISKKPNPKPLEIALNGILGKNPEHTVLRALYVGDYDTDVVAANSIYFEHRGKKVQVDVAYLLGGPEQQYNIKTLPTFFLSLHHLKLTRVNESLHGLPIREFRDLPDIIQFGIGVNSSIEGVGSKTGRFIS